MPDYLQTRERVKMPRTRFVFVSQLQHLTYEPAECCRVVVLPRAAAGAMALALSLCPNPTALLSRARDVRTIVHSQSSNLPRLLVCFEQTGLRGSMRHPVKTLPARSLRERSLHKCLPYRSCLTSAHLSFCRKKACHGWPPFKIDPKEVRT